MPDGLYEHDALAWAEQQADLLRRLAAGERVNAAVDWPNVIEEVQDVGLSELRACRSLLRQALLHLLKLHAWPGSQAAAHWRDEAGVFLTDAEDRFTPSMRQRIGLDELYAKALHLARGATDDAGEPRPLPEACPFTLDELLAARPDVAGLVAKLGGDRT
ncbi:MAG: DUF29 domain-containing protein [Bryobacterales bacterium]|nr:DUF29 domain-containing protein [Bryobacterales bacterium]